MPMFEALRLCPHARVIRPDMDKYSRVGREVRQMMLALTPLVEPLSIDEAFLDLSGTERLHGLIPAQVLARFAADVEEKLRITVSIGLSCNKAGRAEEGRCHRGAQRLGPAALVEAAGVAAAPPSGQFSLRYETEFTHG